MFAVPAIALVLAMLISSAGDDERNDDDAARAGAAAVDAQAAPRQHDDELDAQRATQRSVGLSVGASFTSQPMIDVHGGLWLRERSAGAFDMRGDVAVDVRPGNGGLITADVVALFVHRLSDRLELTIGGGPAGGVLVHERCDVDACSDVVDAVFGVAGVAAGTIDIVEALAVGLELRGLASFLAPTGAPLVSPSLSLTTLWRF